MLSIIVCSRNKILLTEFTDNIKKTVGTDYELIHIDNSENKYSIYSAYNLGISKSKYPYLCLVHEDVLFHSTNWGKNVIAHLQDPTTGILGLAGGDFVTNIPASWATLISPSLNIIQTDAKGRKPTKHLLEPEDYKLSKRSTITLDGVFLCMRQELMQVIHFDENLKGFHGYDYDISLQSTVAGYVNYVIYDIKLEHFSRGKTDVVYFRNLIRIFKKFEKSLPLVGANITDNERQEISIIERRKLYQLTKKMVRKGFEKKEIIAEITYYANKINFPNAIKYLKFRIFLIRLFNCPKYLLRK
ncbi:MAG: glycosyltransferase [Paludibacter sp.]